MNGDHSIPADFRGMLEECATRAMDEDVEGVPELERFRVVSDKTGKFLYLIARATNRQRVLELSGIVGAGSSVVWLAGAVKETGGEVISCETNPRRLVKLQNLLSRARLSHGVDILSYDLMSSLPEGKPSGTGSIDMLVITMTDTDWVSRLEQGWDMLGTSGILVLINTIQATDRESEFLTEFFDSRPSSVNGVRIEEGLLIAYKLSGESGNIAAIQDAEKVGERAADVLLRLEKENRKPGSNYWAIPPDTGRFLWMLTRAMGAGKVLEVGASSGYSGIWLASALKYSGGHLTTMDFDFEKVKLARDSYDRAGIIENVEIIEGDALELVPTLGDKYDLIFLDCGKEFYYDLIDPLLYRLNRGGLLVADNVISHREELGSYLDAVKNHSYLASLTVPIGSGVEMTMVM